MARMIIFVLALITLVRSQSSAIKLAECTTWCLKNYPNPVLTCVLPALRGQGPCYVCGPFKTLSTEELCSGKCTGTASDAKNCGGCGEVCPAGAVCLSSQCQCGNSGQPPCNGACPDLQTDSQNCGKCGNLCPQGTTCTSGACVCTNSGQPPCNGACPDLQIDSQNCGKCGNACPQGGTCVSGACECTAGQSLCGGVCTNTLSDFLNCGSCGQVCPRGTICVSGLCENPPPCNQPCIYHACDSCCGLVGCADTGPCAAYPQFNPGCCKETGCCTNCPLLRS